VKKWDEIKGEAIKKEEKIGVVKKLSELQGEAVKK